MYLTDSYRKRKRIVWLTVIFFFISVFVFLVIPMASAETVDDKEKSDIEAEMKGEVETADKEFEEEKASWSEFKQNYYDYFESACDVLESSLISTVDGVFGTGSATLTDAESSASAMMSGIQSALKMLGMAIVFFVSSIALFKEIQKGESSPEMWMKAGLIAVIGVVILENYDVLISYIEGLGNYLIDLAKDKTSGDEMKITFMTRWFRGVFSFGTGDLQDTSIDILHMDDYWWSPMINNLKIYVITGLKYAGVAIVIIILQVPLMGLKIALYSIWIEIIIRKVFFPLAVADIVGEGVRSPGVIFMKRLFVLYLRIAMSYVIAFVCSLLINKVGASLSFTASGTTIITGIVNVGTICALYLASSKMIGKTSSLASQIAGVR